MRSHVVPAKGFEGPAMSYTEPNASHTVVMERLSAGPFRYASPATLVLRHGNLTPYHNAPGAGRLFIEDSVGPRWYFDHPQHVWARQWNVELHDRDGKAGPSIRSRGATLWALGFKTEYESMKIDAADGAATEVLGAFIYPIGPIPKDRPIFGNRDSRMSLVYGTSVYRSNHGVHVRDTRHGTTLEIGNDRLYWIGSRARMDLFVSDAP